VHWLKKSERFWYVYETTEAKNGDSRPAKQKKTAVRQRKLAAKSPARKRPFRAQHLLIDSIRFIKDEHSIRFEVKSSKKWHSKIPPPKKTP